MTAISQTVAMTLLNQTFICLALCAGSAGLLPAHQSGIPAKNPKVEAPNKPVRLVAYVHPMFSYDFNGLIRAADLVIDGTVVKILPSRLADPANWHRIETDSIIAVAGKYGLTGEISQDHRVVISKEGGKVGNAEVVVPQQPQFQSGGRYFLFLAHDDRSTLPNIEGLPRYIVLGVWAGEFPVIDNKIQTAKTVSSAIQDFDGQEADMFSKALNQFGRRQLSSADLILEPK